MLAPRPPRTMDRMRTTERTMLGIGVIVSLPLSAFCAWEYATVTGGSLLDTLLVGFLVGLTFGMLTGAAVGQFLRYLPLRQINGGTVLVVGAARPRPQDRP